MDLPDKLQKKKNEMKSMRKTDKQNVLKAISVIKSVIEATN